jgi:hypothetical protein
LRDAVNNVIEVVENEEYCLVFDEPVGSGGLTWETLVAWWARTKGSDPDDVETPRDLYRRLRRSLSKESPGERVVFDAYGHFYGAEFRGTSPVLLPQVYLHYDPYTKRELVALDQSQTLARQRMDFLLLLSERVRIVVEVDGKHHYATGDRASPEKYAEMVAEDRALRLAGYEIYRFGASELLSEDGPKRARDFFDSLFDRHDL